MRDSQRDTDTDRVRQRQHQASSDSSTRLQSIAGTSRKWECRGQLGVRPEVERNKNICRLASRCGASHTERILEWHPTWLKIIPHSPPLPPSTFAPVWVPVCLCLSLSVPRAVLSSPHPAARNEHKEQQQQQQQ